MKDKTKFLTKNLIKGLLWLAILIALMVYASSLLDNVSYDKYLKPIYDRPFWVYFAFLVSEIVFGIIPPEVFMFWSAHKQDLLFYIFSMTLFAVFSYSAGVIGYFIGNRLHHSGAYAFLKQRVFKEYVHYFEKFGGFLIIVAALTPLPFSAISMLIGMVKFPFGRFLTFASFRFARFSVYAVIIWHATHL